MLLERLGKELLYFDGGMGTLLQSKGLKPGELPEVWNIEHADEVVDIHRQYFEAGSDIVLANTFGANALKFHDASYDLKEIVNAAIENVKKGACLGAGAGRRTYTALDVGPTGKLLKPMGDLEFEEAYEAFREVMKYGEEAGADLIHIETMSDTYEVKAAVLAAKENTELPVFATMIFDEKGKLLTGGDVPSVVALLEGLRVDALGINCGMGPEQMLPILEEILAYTSLPVIVKPNAGLPKQRDGQVYYDVDPEQFARTMEKIVHMGACVIGGCCGTTPGHICAMIDRTKGLSVVPPSRKDLTIVSSYGKAVVLGEKPVIIGERINPTGKKKFKQALKDHDLDYILKEGIMQQDKGAHILDVNVGLPDIDEAAMMQEVVTQLQSVTSLPLQIDTVDAKAMEAAMRIYNGKPMVNSVNGKKESMDEVFPLIRKYGGVVIGLTIDEEGIPQTAEGRVKVAGKIIEEAGKYGIDKKDIVIDVLAMTISSEPEGAKVTLDALKGVREAYGVRTVLGVSNISFGLPYRPAINSNFYTMAMQNGLSAGIINPSSEDMMRSYYSFCALMNYDSNCEAYIRQYGSQPVLPASSEGSRMTLKEAIEKGLKEEAHHATRTLLKEQEPLSIINQYLIPALNVVGKGFEKGTIFLPQLLMSADAAKIAFAVLKDELAKSGGDMEKKDKIILATVKGDIHDIGKNIVKVLLENYSFDVIDLGKDVPPKTIVETAIKEEVSLVGLSALMTTTVTSMEETIRLLRKHKPDCKVMVGGAVLNQDYADMIGADFYGKDAMQSVYYAQRIFGHE
ncbi:homocysteine S-methyltransferase family protein [[Clostridium] scindens]|uniref:homocysteine S-methyltransferase family protein n=1 Tax=Clostridium scindens (strain JCM 10418 / VPI 12708) TaxID=29347 RepID=UPI001D06502A|nr:homocysteine S-methyltransferase family protein [[Clostridium] scindens]MCB6645125.1 homocysteine S-methyltransferase family protein [[Clostridium] scindens]